MKPKRIVLVRHGESQGNADAAIRATVPDHSLQLTDKGHAEAQGAGKKLAALFAGEPLRVYLSPYRRTRQTWESIQLGAEPTLNVAKQTEDPRLREQDFGHLRPAEAHRQIDQERDHFGTFFYRIKDGESGADVYDRISIFLDSLWRDFEKPEYPPNTLIVTHGLTIRLFMMRWFHWSVERFENLRNPRNAEHYVMEVPNRNDPSSRFELLTPMREYTDEETAAYRQRLNERNTTE
jgi:broad specificity phosphatase PhoE